MTQSTLPIPDLSPDAPDRHALFREIMLARDRVYAIAPPTPIDQLTLPDGRPFSLKREDRSSVHSYKWRGAANTLTRLAETNPDTHVVAASAGNHAQGVAIASAALGLRATVFMPRSTPEIKVHEVGRIGGANVTIRSEGDTFDDASRRARRFALDVQAHFVHPYDDPLVMAGQGTIGDEIITANCRPDRVYLQIGGGGMASGVACVLKTYYPDITIIGVEGEDQASMAAAVRAGQPTPLDRLDRFCDGTAVRTAGVHTHRICAELIDRYVTVSNDEICGAMRFLWEACRTIPEPSGAMGVAALLRHEQDRSDGHPLAVLTGANMDFAALSWIARHGRIARQQQRHLRLRITEEAGALVRLLDAIASDDLNICDFQYGKTDRQHAEPVIGFAAPPSTLADLDRRLRSAGVRVTDETDAVAVDFRAIPMRPDLFRRPIFVLIEFADRPGALLEFMRTMRDTASICYFNYSTTGRTEGHAMMGFEFDSDDARARFTERLDRGAVQWRQIPAPLPPSTDPHTLTQGP